MIKLEEISFDCVESHRERLKKDMEIFLDSYFIEGSEVHAKVSPFHPLTITVIYSPSENGLKSIHLKGKDYQGGDPAVFNRAFFNSQKFVISLKEREYEIGLS
ncbi:MAG: hypothetical protein KJ949_02395, partial [Nanoarchaeota archaeon]|nr:hypothetical protein [Nanoarchaeota archaeon]MBU4308501.1 hypothetical protein [Nanoarchaeota archaeon]